MPSIGTIAKAEPGLNCEAAFIMRAAPPINTSRAATTPAIASGLAKLIMSVNAAKPIAKASNATARPINNPTIEPTFTGAAN